MDYPVIGRPSSTKILPSFGEQVKHLIIKLRRQHPGWGPKSIHAQLSIHPKLNGTKLPSVRSIANLLKKEGLVRSYSKHVPIPNGELLRAHSAHHVWQVDAQGGLNLDHIGPISMINIRDVFSRTYCMAYPNKKKSVYGSCKRQDYQCALRLAFMEYGLPQVIQTDHEGVYYETKSKSPFPTSFHLWLIGLGIAKVFGRFHQPTDQALVERMHQTIAQQAIQGIEHSSWEALFNFCQKQRKFLNEAFPCASLNNRPPYAVFPKAKHSGRYYHLLQEESLIDLNRIFDFLQLGRWYRKASKLRSVTIGGQVYYVSKAKPKSELLITFDRENLMLNFHNDKELLIQKIPIRGINKKKLIGEIFWKMTNVQLELPLFWDTQKISTTFLHFDSTT